MEETILSSTLGNRVYSTRSMRLGILIGGPLVVGYFMAANYRQLGEPRKAAKAWLWSIVGFVFILVLSLFLPDSIPNIAYALTYYGIAGYFIQKYQGLQITAHIDAGGCTYKTYRALLAGLVSFLVLVGFVLVCFVIADLMKLAE